MSPSWNSHLYITISPERISLRKLSRGLKPRLLAQHDEVIDTSGRSSSQVTSPSSWQVVVDRLNQLLSQPEWQNTEVDIVLSNRLVRYAVIPFREQLKKYSEQEAFARHTLHKTYGSMAEQFELRIQHGKVGVPSLISAVDRKLLEDLRQACLTHKLKLRSVTPYVMQVFNSHSKDIKRNLAWLVINEPNYSLLALLKDGVITSVSGVILNNVRELPIQLNRANLASTLTEPCKSVYLYTSAGDDLSAIAQGEYETTRLDAAIQEGFPEFVEGLYTTSGWRKRKLELDYQQPVERPNRRAGWLLLATSLTLLFDMGITYDRLHNDRAEIEREFSVSKIPLNEGSRSSVSGQFTDKDFDEVRKIIGRLSTPWNVFFTALETVNNENVAILSITPDMQTGLLRIEGEAKDYAAVLTLIAQLRTTKPFSNVYLINHDIKRDDPQHPVSFAVSLRWVKPS